MGDADATRPHPAPRLGPAQSRAGYGASLTKRSAAETATLAEDSAALSDHKKLIGSLAYDAEAARVCFFLLERVRLRPSGWGGSAGTFPFV